MTFRLLVLLLVRPVEAMSQILDRGSLLIASLAALAISLIETSLLPVRGLPFYLPLLLLAAVYVPAALAIARLAGYSGDYASLLTCAGLAWTASQLPVLVAAFLPGPLWLGVFAASILYFTLLMFLAVRNVFGMTGPAAGGTVAFAFLPLLAVPFVWPVIGFLVGWLASPFFLIYAWYFLGSELGGIGAGLRNRQHFYRMLQAAAVNPHDGDAQYQLGLIYQQRHNYAEAIERFRKAVAIDPTETDAHFQLGRIARMQGRLSDALSHFQTVLRQDPRHSASEILRDLGAVDLETGNLPEARKLLDDYVERREYDPEGLYYLGRVLEQSGDREQARQMYSRAIEAARTAPRYRRRLVSHWSRLAQKALRSVS